MIIAIEINESTKVRVFVDGADRTGQIQDSARLVVRLAVDAASFVASIWRAWSRL